MLSDRLRTKPLYKWVFEKKFNPTAKELILGAVTKLTLLMRMIEEAGIMSREDIEDCVICALEFKEAMYYGMDKESLEAVIDKEIANDKVRKGNIKSV